MEHADFKKIISFAIEKEEEAASFYEAISNIAERPEIREMFKELSAWELRHRQILQGVDEAKIADYKLEEVADLKIGDYLIEGEFSPEMKYQEVLILAIKREAKAHKMYTDLANNFTGGPQKTFLALAQEEAKHKLKLETEYDEYVLRED